MRILYFTGGYSPHDQRFVQALLECDQEIFYLGYSNEISSLEDRTLPDKVYVLPRMSERRDIGWHEIPRQIAALKHEVRKIDPDIIHAGPIHVGARLAAIGDFHPLVTMSWGSDLLVGGRKGFDRFAAKFTLNRSDSFLCDCEEVRSVAIQLGMDERRIIMFPWGVDLEHFTPGDSMELRKDLGWEDKFVLISTRAWEPLYGVEILLKAFILATQEDPSMRLLLLGTGSQASRLKALITDAGIQDRVQLAGIIPQASLPEYFRAADLYISASHSDGSSVSLLEAMACGLSALVSDIPGNLEWIQDQVNGYVFPDNDVQTLAKKIVLLAQRRDTLQITGLEARNTVEARANWKVNSLKLLDAYQIAVQHSKRKIR